MAEQMTGKVRRVAVVTGASSGIGRAIAKRIAADGIAVVATGRRHSRLSALQTWSEERGFAIAGVAGDATEPGLVGRLFDAAFDRWGMQPSLFVLCAGHGLAGSLLTSDPERWNTLFDVNCVSALRQIRDSAERLLALAGQEPGKAPFDLVVIGSTVGRQVSARNPVYGATKFALHSAVESLRQEVCSAGLRVTLIEPGFVLSEFQAVAGYDPAWFEDIEREQGPFLKPDDVAASVLFAIGRPPHVHIDDIRIRPTRQKV
jgi:NADP-dependent 3-hydroxy acid dehydrogenase YdfG